MVLPIFSRRAILAGSLATPLGAIAARGGRSEQRVTLLGQSLIQQDLCALDWPGRDAIQAHLSAGGVVFTDLETAIHGAGDVVPTRAGEVLHAAPASVIDCLRTLGVSLVATSNNHAWDLGTPGVLAALTALDARGLSHAGSGRNLDTATTAGFAGVGRGRVALVAAAAGAIREGAAATATRSGVNELRRDASQGLNTEDIARTLDAIRAARRGGGAVIAYLHNHYWEADPAVTPEWQRDYARRCIDAGASIFVAHGPPLLQGIERYKGIPLLHGLGSFIFQTRKPQGSYDARTWESLMVDVTFRYGAFVRASATPLRLDSMKEANGEFTSGVPSFAGPLDGVAITTRLADLSMKLGTKVSVIAGQIQL